MVDSDTRATIVRYYPEEGKTKARATTVEYEADDDVTEILDFQILCEIPEGQIVDDDEKIGLKKATYTKLNKQFKNAGK